MKGLLKKLPEYAATDWGAKTTANPGPHGFSEILYAYTSATGNNGSAFGGLNPNTPWYNGTLGLAMLIGRFLMIVPLLGRLLSSRWRAASHGCDRTSALGHCV